LPEASTPKWRRFEQLVARVQAAFAPDAQVTLDDKVFGKKSGVERQIDIAVRRNIGQFEILVVIDCKDHKDPLDVKDVEEFIGLVEDVGANKGALVSPVGFSEAARVRATNSGIDLYRLVDAEDHDWRTYVALPFVCDFRGLGSGRFVIRGSHAILSELADQDPKLIPVYGQDRNRIGTPLTLLWAKWNRREIPSEPGSYVGIELSSETTYVRSKDGQFEEVRFEGNCEVVKKLYFGELPLTKVTGFRDEVSGNLVLPGNSEIVTDWIDTVEVERSWLRIPSIDALAIKPTMILEAFDFYPSEIPVELN
jgi:hypothetical protein